MQWNSRWKRGEKMKNSKCINENVNLNDYLSLYDNVRKSMPHSEWLGRFEKEQIIEILSYGEKIYIYQST